ncbi:UNVERIFIED_CONTAM: hypothetical protein GTU68_061704 [Idotea baltica]|nr:hypothetical protein [Idotea baltica]
MNQHIVSSIEQLSLVAKSLLNFKNDCKIFILNGEPGAGKTTFVKNIAQQLGCTEEITSPTYSIVNEYAANEMAIYHFDLYRMESYEEILDIGFWEYFDDNAFVFIEWADLVISELDKYVIININTLANESRVVSFEAVGF